MLIPALQFAAGLVLLYLGAEWLVRGAASLALAWGVGGLTVGLTVVAFGTSAPELLVSTVGAVRGAAGVSIGNVVGSNIANVGLILALAALVRPVRVHERAVRVEIPLVIAATLLLGLLALDGRLGRLDAVVLLAAFGAYMAYLLKVTPRGAAEATGAEATDGAEPPWPELDEPEEATGPSDEGPDRRRSVALVLLGLAGLVVGAHLLVESAVAVALRLGVSEVTVGLTIVAVGTSLPELASTLVATGRRQADLAVGNVVGSNLFNILLILGASALVRPLPVAPDLYRLELPAMLLFALVLLPLAFSRGTLQRWEGMLLLAGYATFLLLLAGP